jgi:hypothetical protein
VSTVSGRAAAGVFSLVVSACLVACSASHRPQSSRIDAAFESFDRFQQRVARTDPTTRAFATKIGGWYRDTFSPYQTEAAISQLETSDVLLLFRAADSTFFYTVSPALIRDMQLDLAELHRRGVDRVANDETVYAALIEARSFDEARSFAEAHGLASAETPVVRDASVRGRPTALVVEAGGKRLDRVVIDLNQRLVVVASPLCHFCQRAVRSIDDDARLRALVRAHAVWIVPPDETISFAMVAKWNRDHPDEQMLFAYRREEWPMIDRWETPVFSFFRAGRVVSRAVGWPPAGRKPELERGFQRAGLLAAKDDR